MTSADNGDFEGSIFGYLEFFEFLAERNEVFFPEEAVAEHDLFALHVWEHFCVEVLREERVSAWVF